MKNILTALTLLIATVPLSAQTKEAGEIGKRYSPDPNKPLPLSMTSPYQRDRMSFADVSLPASIRAAQQRIEPRRPNPATFTPTNLPDPFENRRALPATPLPESTEIPLFVIPPTTR